MPRRPDHYPVGGWPTKRELVFVRMNGSWLVASGYPMMLFADGQPYRTWRNWPGDLELGTLRPRGCTGRLVQIEEAIAYTGEAGMLREFGATVAHVCRRLHHVELSDWCWCDRCFAHRNLERGS
ncbi:hypothetical protein WHI96_02775 [Pseudonocardia tropica]|uniref:Uncharacterized protein n=1 Tax=Pseudonocardia tropica TaxID=681289 RepID=A0ABV1JP74_9PSEU